MVVATERASLMPMNLSTATAGELRQESMRLKECLKELLGFRILICMMVCLVYKMQEPLTIPMPYLL